MCRRNSSEPPSDTTRFLLRGTPPLKSGMAPSTPPHHPSEFCCRPPHPAGKPCPTSALHRNRAPTSRLSWCRQPRHRVNPERGDRALGMHIARRPAWAIGPLWLLVPIRSSKPWAKKGSGTVPTFIHYPKSVFWFKIPRNSFKIQKFLINHINFRKRQSKFCLNPLKQIFS
jgi:hypothetical protein